MMDRAQFMQALEKLLADISETERQDALDFYNSYFDDAGAEINWMFWQMNGKKYYVII